MEWNIEVTILTFKERVKAKNIDSQCCGPELFVCKLVYFLGRKSVILCPQNRGYYKRQKYSFF